MLEKIKTFFRSKKKPIYELVTFEIEGKYPVAKFNKKSGKIEVFVRELNPILIIRDPKTGKIEERDFESIKKNVSKEDLKKIEEFRRKTDRVIVFSFKLEEWESVKDLFDKKSRKVIENFIERISKEV